MTRRNLNGEERREYIIELLKRSSKPLTGKMLAKETGVSRQVIVTDIALLRTAEEPIIATSRGYIYYQNASINHLYRKVIVCNHTSEDIKKELEIIVNCGVTVVDVIVEHPFYGDLAGSLMIKNKSDINSFMNALDQTVPLSILTDGLHLHTLESDSMENITLACKALKKAGILVTESR